MALNPQQIRTLISQHKRRDMLFDMLGLAVMLLAILVLFALFTQLVIDGAARLRPDFFTHFASRHAEQDGILSAWVRSEEPTSELQSLLRHSYAVYCLSK